MKPYIPKQPRQTLERLEIKLEHSLVQKLERYCEYLESDRDYVIGCVLQVVFRKDKGFGDWLRSQHASVPAQPAAGRSAQVKSA